MSYEYLKEADAIKFKYMTIQAAVVKEGLATGDFDMPDTPKDNESNASEREFEKPSNITAKSDHLNPYQDLYNEVLSVESRRTSVESSQGMKTLKLNAKAHNRSKSTSDNLAPTNRPLTKQPTSTISTSAIETGTQKNISRLSDEYQGPIKRADNSHYSLFDQNLSPVKEVDTLDYTKGETSREIRNELSIDPSRRSQSLSIPTQGLAKSSQTTAIPEEPSSKRKRETPRFKKLQPNALEIVDLNSPTQRNYLHLSDIIGNFPKGTPSDLFTPERNGNHSFSIERGKANPFEAKKEDSLFDSPPLAQEVSINKQNILERSASKKPSPFLEGPFTGKSPERLKNGESLATENDLLKQENLKLREHLVLEKERAERLEKELKSNRTPSKSLESGKKENIPDWLVNENQELKERIEELKEMLQKEREKNGRYETTPDGKLRGFDSSGKKSFSLKGYDSTLDDSKRKVKNSRNEDLPRSSVPSSNEYREKDKEIALLVSVNQELVMANKQLKADLEDEKSQNQAKIQDLEQIIRRYKELLQEEDNHLKKENKELKEKLEDLQTQIKIETEKNAHYEERFKNLEQDLERDEEKLQNIMVQLKELKTKNGDLEIKLQQELQRGRKLKGDIITKETEITNLTEEKENYRKKVEELSLESVRLQEWIDELRIKLDQETQKNNNLRAKLAEKEKEHLEALKSRGADNEEIARLKQENEELLLKVEELQEQVTHEIENRQELERKLLQKEKTLNSARKHRENDNFEMQSALEREKELQAKIEELEARLQQESTKTQKLREELNKVERELNNQLIQKEQAFRETIERKEHEFRNYVDSKETENQQYLIDREREIRQLRSKIDQLEEKNRIETEISEKLRLKTREFESQLKEKDRHIQELYERIEERGYSSHKENYGPSRSQSVQGREYRLSLQPRTEDYENQVNIDTFRDLKTASGTNFSKVYEKTERVNNSGSQPKKLAFSASLENLRAKSAPKTRITIGRPNSIGNFFAPVQVGSFIRKKLDEESSYFSPPREDPRHYDNRSALERPLAFSMVKASRSSRKNEMSSSQVPITITTRSVSPFQAEDVKPVEVKKVEPKQMERRKSEVVIRPETIAQVDIIKQPIKINHEDLPEKVEIKRQQPIKTNHDDLAEKVEIIKLQPTKINHDDLPEKTNDKLLKEACLKSRAVLYEDEIIKIECTSKLDNANIGKEPPELIISFFYYNKSLSNIEDFEAIYKNIPGIFLPHQLNSQGFLIMSDGGGKVPLLKPELIHQETIKCKMIGQDQALGTLILQFRYENEAKAIKIKLPISILKFITYKECKATEYVERRKAALANNKNIDSPKFKLNEKSLNLLKENLFNKLVVIPTEGKKGERFNVYGGILLLEDNKNEIFIRVIVEIATSLSMLQLVCAESQKKYAERIMKMLMFVCDQETIL